MYPCKNPSVCRVKNHIHPKNCKAARSASVKPTLDVSVKPPAPEHQSADVDFGFDPYSVTRFTQGGCQDLAVELHDRYGLEMVGLFEDGSNSIAAHYVNRLPDGRLVDIFGTHNEDDLLEEWSDESGIDLHFHTLSAIEANEFSKNLSLERQYSETPVEVVTDEYEFDSTDFVDPARYAEQIVRELGIEG